MKIILYRKLLPFFLVVSRYSKNKIKNETNNPGFRGHLLAGLHCHQEQLQEDPTVRKVKDVMMNG